ncbi:MAG: Homoserine kinase [Chlamydiia bacterium]|nr:Homoserine kinase [Chlamydiia bacterium]MCH9618717.1 Homoserine kinase [Chlamydiia bacterium]MCH9624397.1 Homoserine kinase [Chlamydiia bacterium]
MNTISKKRRTWKRAPVKRIQTLVKENADQKIERVIHEEKTALLITYKKGISLKDLSFLKKATSFLTEKNLPFSSLLSFDHTKDGYRGTWSLCPGKVSSCWNTLQYKGLGEFLGKMHSITKHHTDNSLQKLPIILSLKDQYTFLKDSLGQSFESIPTLLEKIEKKWPLFLPTGLVHTDLFPNNILFKQNTVSGILQNHNLQMDILLYDLAAVIKTLYFSKTVDIEEKEKAFFKAYTSFCPLNKEEILAISTLTSAKLLQNTLSLIEKHLKSDTYKETYLNSAVISLIHAEKALHLYT